MLGRLCRRVSEALSFWGTGGISTGGCGKGKGTFHADITGGDIINPSWGFSDGRYQPYDYNKMLNSLRNRKHVIMKAYEDWLFYLNSWINAINYCTGHVWVMDGHRTTTTTYTYRINTYMRYSLRPINVYGERFVRTSSRSYTRSKLNPEVHNNWGWGHDIHAEDTWVGKDVFFLAPAEEGEERSTFNVRPDMIVQISPK